MTPNPPTPEYLAAVAARWAALWSAVTGRKIGG
jgi:hypothetical protein